jgi:hypothetical protein
MSTTYSNFGALTTVFTPAPSCSTFRNQVYTLQGTVTTIYFRQGGHSDCYPGSVMYNYHYSVGNLAVENPYFSPAISCPQGWATSATLQSAIEAGDEQIYICCPSLVIPFFLWPMKVGNCADLVDTGNRGWTWSFNECLTEYADLHPTVRDETLDGFTWVEGPIETHSYSPNDLNNWPVEIHFRESDLSGAATTSSSASKDASQIASQGGAASSTSRNSKSTSTVSAVPTGTSQFAPSTSGLSTGAKIAIGVVIPVFVILLLLGLFFFFRRRRRRQVAAANEQTWPEDAKSPELDGTMRNELPGDAGRRPAELEDLPSPRSELEGFPSPISDSMSPRDSKQPAELG